MQTRDEFDRAVRTRLILVLKARSEYYMAVLNLVRLWCTSGSSAPSGSNPDRATVIRVMGIIRIAVKDKEQWLLTARLENIVVD